MNLENFELYRDTLLTIRLIISMLGVLIIVLGAVRSAYQLIMYLIKEHYTLMTIRLQFGDAVLMGLEFMVGGDIVGSLVAPDYYNLGLLAIIVVIRTILSYFLSRELKVLLPNER